MSLGQRSREQRRNQVRNLRDSLAQQLGDEIARWRQNVEPAFKAAVKEANADLAEVPVSASCLFVAV